MEPLQGLRELATIDRSMAELLYQREHLPEHDELRDIDSHVASLGKEFGEIDVVRRPLKERRDEIESIVHQQRDRRDELAKRLAVATGGGKELEAMAGEIAHLDASIDTLETEELEIMLQLEPLDESVQRIKRDAAAASQRRESLGAEITDAQTRCTTDIAALQATRGEIVSYIPDSVVRLYQQILAKVHDVAAVELVDGVCGGCRIAGVAMDIGRWRSSNLDSLVTCPECTRIWIPAS
ncbi:MAG: hypothetical protein KJS64_00565 [Acidobacteria bacterium]|nr:hypothetical protein [Acidobacteriota bacterium]